MTLNEFFNKYNGKKVDYDGLYKNQCKDLFSFYNRDVVGNQTYIYGDAWQLYNNAPDTYYEKLTGIIPRKGDVVIWNKPYGGYGHVGIVMDANSQGMLVFSQNHTGNLDPCELTNYNYSYIRGYLRPKGENMAWYSIKGAIFHDDVYVGDPNIVPWGEVNNLNPQGYELTPVGKLAELEMAKNNLIQGSIDKQNTITSLQKEILDLKEEGEICHNLFDVESNEKNKALEKLDKCNIALDKCKNASNGVVGTSIWKRFVAWIKKWL